jgi:hypothetical protein
LRPRFRSISPLPAVQFRKRRSAGATPRRHRLAEGAGQEAVGKAIESREAGIVVNHAMLALVEERRRAITIQRERSSRCLLNAASARRTGLLRPRHPDGRSWLHERRCSNAWVGGTSTLTGAPSVSCHWYPTMNSLGTLNEGIVTRGRPPRTRGGRICPGRGPHGTAHRHRRRRGDRRQRGLAPGRPRPRRRRVV